MTGVDLQRQWLGFSFFLKIENDYVAQSAWSQTHYYRVQANTEPFVLIFEILGSHPSSAPGHSFFMLPRMAWNFKYSGLSFLCTEITGMHPTIQLFKEDFTSQ